MTVLIEGVQRSRAKHITAHKYASYDDLPPDSLPSFYLDHSNNGSESRMRSLNVPSGPFGSDLRLHPRRQPLDSAMLHDALLSALSTASATPTAEDFATAKPLEWDWDVEHADRKREDKADAALHHISPFQVDRSLLKDVVREKFGVAVVRIRFLSSGTFHKAYLVTLINGKEIVGRVARRYMPRLKTQSEVATMQYLHENTSVPVPMVYHYDSNPYNRLGGEYILMSKAAGRPLAEVYHSLDYEDLVSVLTNIAKLVIPLFGHRFSQLGSLYFGPSPPSTPALSNLPTPKPAFHSFAHSFSPALAMSHLSLTPNDNPSARPSSNYHVGPIISWPFFGSNRGDLVHPTEINRGPWPSTEAYFESCAEREVEGVVRENEGKAAPHKLHLDPDEIQASRHHHLKAVPGDQSDDSDEYDLEESEEEWDGPGDVMYRDYRRMQRSTFLVAHLSRRVDTVKAEMNRWMKLMDKMMKKLEPEGNGSEAEVFSIDCHDLSLENIFIDEDDPTKITCIIDWESTTTRPLWQCAHLPAFLQSSPFTAKLFREIVVQMAETSPADSSHSSFEELAKEWLYYEERGARLRMAHRFIEWDGWEEGLVDGILGPQEDEEHWLEDPVEEPGNVVSTTG